MTTTGGSSHIGIVIEAQDKVSGPVNKIGQSLRKNLGTSLKSAGLSMLSFTSLLGGIGLSLTALIVVFRKWVSEVRNANRSIAVMATRLEVAGFSADRTAAAMERLRSNLSRTAIAALPGLTEAAADFILSLGGPALKDFTDQARILSQVYGVDMKKAMEVLAQAYQGNFTEFNKITRAQITSAEEVLPLLTKAYKNFTNELTMGERVWRVFGQIMRNLFVDKNQVIEWALVFGDAGDVIGAFFDTLFGRNDKKDDEAIQRINDAAKSWALGLLKSFAEFLLGEEAVKIIQEALQGNWAAAWKILREDVLGWGELTWSTALEGAAKWLKDNLFSWVQDNLIEPLGRIIEAKKSQFMDMGRSIATHLGNGIMDFLQGVLDSVAAQITSWIASVVSQLNRLPFVNVTAPTITGPRLPRFTAPVPTPPGSIHGGNVLGPDPPQALIVNLNGREVGRAMLEVLDGQLRTREPGLSLGLGGSS